LRELGQANITEGATQTRIGSLDKCWAKFEEQHDRLCAGFREVLKSHDYVRKDFFALWKRPT
jgi:hypothetical protein